MTVERPRLVPTGNPPDDNRVVAVRAVLAGESAAEVARRLQVDVAVLHRWVTAFVDAGTAQVTNRPTGGEERQRDRFLAAFAHETRTPLAVARGWVEILKEDDDASPRANRTVARLDEALERLAERSRDVELLACASLGLIRPRPVRVSVNDLAARHHLTQAVEADDAVLVVDPDLIARVLRDLWAAASLPPEPDLVRLEHRRAGPWADLRVHRRGTPIDPGTLRTLFEPFDLNQDGSGITIGLYLARALAVAQGGTIGVEQDETSTTFWVRIPRENAPTS